MSRSRSGATATIDKSSVAAEESEDSEEYDESEETLESESLLSESEDSASASLKLNSVQAVGSQM